MIRRVTPVRWFAFSVSAFSLLIGFAGAVSAASSRPPNILHIHSDDHRADALHALGTEELDTPNLDQLVARGTTFRHCYTMGAMTPAVCLPSRTMMLTGRSLFRIGPPGKNVPGTTPLPTVLKTAGYDTSVSYTHLTLPTNREV